MSRFYSRENLRFLLHEVFKAGLLNQREYFKDHTTESMDMMIDAAEALAVNYLRPLLREMDNQPPYLENGRIKVHPAMKGLMQRFGEDGWISMSAPYALGGQQAPFIILQACAFIMAAANYSTMAYPFLTTGAAHLIESFGSAELQQTFIPKMFSGAWQGTMALTEPQAGSSLSDVMTLAQPTDKGYYLMKGQKVFISCGDHDACENIVHLMLARIMGAPVGTKGISLFVVPRLRPEGNELVFNDVHTAGVFHKMGYHGAPIAHLIMGEYNNCRGWLVGEPHKGLGYMFQMMNEARVGVGIQASAIATAAYYNALEYTRVRLQGRNVADKDPAKPQIPIIRHADVKRMLLFQKAIVEGSLALCLQAALYYDLWKTGKGEEAEENFLKLELLTPVVKSYPAEMSILATSAALQCFGGYGYTKDYMAELFYRETRIHTLHEGVTAIHGIDLLGRKVPLQGGRATMLLIQEVMRDIDRSRYSERLESYAIRLEEEVIKLQQITQHLMETAQTEGAEVFLADATLYLELFGIIAVGWQWLKQGYTAEELLKQGSASYTREFLHSKMYALQYFYEYEMPKTEALHARLKSENHLTVRIPEEEIL
ncbi:MAG: acyl-CoA dehydrogenase [Chitinophagales bacterium]|nr:MAG: acyl-CoA dehydrogenase [Chitinophagales bacterium]